MRFIAMMVSDNCDETCTIKLIISWKLVHYLTVFFTYETTTCNYKHYSVNSNRNPAAILLIQIMGLAVT